MGTQMKRIQRIFTDCQGDFDQKEFFAIGQLFAKLVPIFLSHDQNSKTWKTYHFTLDLPAIDYQLVR
jgi:hypothetical protein